MKRSKYGNRRTQIDGHWFDSQAEGRRYQELKLLLRAGEITDLEIHPAYELQPPYHRRDGSRVRAMFYEADFQYVEGGKVVVEDVKGTQTAIFKIKRKLFECQYPEFEFRLVMA
jgi:hypothetical protein